VRCSIHLSEAVSIVVRDSSSGAAAEASSVGPRTSAGDDAPPLRPTRSSPRAPFVAAPATPRTAEAPLVAAPTTADRPSGGARHTARVAFSATAARDSLHGDRPSVSERRRAVALVVARFPHGAFLDPLVASIAPRSIELSRLEGMGAAHVPRSLLFALRNALVRATFGAAFGGAIGVLAGALTFGGEALAPLLGWIPGPAFGAAFGGGVLGAVGFIVGAFAALARPIPRAGDPGVILVVRARTFDVDAIVAKVLDAGGSIAAVGEV
jgi:hypothetical protein